MFPDSWSKPQVVRAVENAFDNHHMLSTNMWEGTSDGVKIQGYIKDGQPTTAFPAPDQPSVPSLLGLGNVPLCWPKE